MSQRCRWDRTVVAAAVPLLGLCALGPDARYAAVTLATLVPLVVLSVQLARGVSPDRRAWFVMLAGTAFLAAHNGQNEVAVARSGALATGLAAGVTLALGWSLMLVGGALATRRYLRHDPGGMLDAAMIGLAAAGLMWGVLLHPALLRLGAGSTRMVYEMSLVLIVTALTGTIVRTVVVSPQIRPAAAALLVAMGTADAGDVALTLTEDRVTGLSAWWASLPCILALVAFALALAHPSIRAASSGTAVPARVPAGGFTSSRLVFLAAALAVNPALTAAQQIVGGPTDVTLLSLGSLFMVPLVAARIASLARRQADVERRLQDLASRDHLTGLLNRRALIEHLDALLARVAAGDSPGAVVVYLDLDEFKSVNDTHGHLTGDRLLCAVAGRLRSRVRAGDVVARFGGDEFVLVLEGEPEVASAAVVDGVERALAEPVAIGAVMTSGRASVGVATVRRGDRADAENLLHLADAQMYLDKRLRRGWTRQ